MYIRFSHFLCNEIEAFNIETRQILDHPEPTKYQCGFLEAPRLLHKHSLFVLTASGEVHGMRDGIVAVDGQGDQHVCWRECNHSLQEPDYLAKHITSQPRHRDPPSDVRWYADQTDCQICIKSAHNQSECMQIKIPHCHLQKYKIIFVSDKK